MKEKNLTSASFKDFENMPGLNLYEQAHQFDSHLNWLDDHGYLNYRLETMTGCGPKVKLKLRNSGKIIDAVSLVSNDYLGFTQHPQMKAAAIAAIVAFGTGAGASPAIGGHFSFHEQLEQKIAAFFQRESALIYTTGYTANSATLQCLLKGHDIAIIDRAVHSSVIEGCQLTNVKTFPHNDLEALETVLANTKGKYRNRMVIIDGVYSQDGDLAHLKAISALVKQYEAYLMVDDAHGIGVIGETGRGVIELENLYQDVDLITGTFSKTFGHIGGFVVGHPDIIRFLKFQARQHLFSVTASPAAACILKSIELIDAEPEWMVKLWHNVNYLKTGFLNLGLDIGNTESAILPVKTGDAALAGEAGKLLLEAGVYANPIIYPAVSRKDSRIRMSVMATHTAEQLDQVLNAFEWVSQKLPLRKGIPA